MNWRGIFLTRQLPILVAIVVAILAIRSSIVEPFRIPTRSMLPGLMMGDFLFVSKMHFDFHFPFTENLRSEPWILSHRRDPERGDVIVFTPPEAGQESLYIKRIVGIPGDRIEFVGKNLWINGTAIPKVEILGAEREAILNHPGFDPDNRYDQTKLRLYQESVTKNSNYLILEDDLFEPRRDQRDLVIPDGNYFVLGDNRDDTKDSRSFGIIPKQSIRGKALVIWLSYRISFSDGNWSFRLNRIGREIR